MEFYWMTLGGKSSEYILQIFEDDLPYSNWDLREGIDLSNETVPIVTVVYRNDAVLHNIANVNSPMVISEKLKNILFSTSYGKLQVFPIIAERKDKMEKCTLYVINCLSVVDALNEKESVGALMDGKFKAIKPAINIASTDGLDMFLLKGDGYRIFITERLKRAIKKSGINDIDFSPIKGIEN